MIQIEFLGAGAGPARPSLSRPREGGGDGAFLDVLARAAGRPAEAVKDGAGATESAVVGATEGGEEAVDAPTAETIESELADDTLLVETGPDPLLAHDDRVAAAIAAADPKTLLDAPFEVAPVAAPASSGGVKTGTDGPAVPSATSGQAQEAEPGRAPSEPARPSAPTVAGTQVMIAERVMPAALASPSATARAPDAADPSGGAVAATLAAGAAIVAGAPAAASATTGGDGAIAPMLPAEAGTPAARTVLAAAGSTGPAGSNSPMPGAPAASASSAAALFAAEGARPARDLPARRAAYPTAGMSEGTARVTSGAGAMPGTEATAQAPGAPAAAVERSAAALSSWGEAVAEAASGQSGRDDLGAVAISSASQSARAQPMAFAAAEPAKVAQQIAEAVKQGRDGSIELALSPKELGTVRISIQATETGTAIVMSAEREETMQLLRRHAEMLHEAFRESGMGTLDLSFGRPDGRGGEAGARQGGTGAEPGNPAAAPDPQPPAPRVSDGGLDLRM